MMAGRRLAIALAAAAVLAGCGGANVDDDGAAGGAGSAPNAQEPGPVETEAY